MATTDEVHEDLEPGRQRLALGLATLTTVPGIALWIGDGQRFDPVLALRTPYSVLSAGG